MRGPADSSGGLAKHAFEHVALHKFGMRVQAEFVKVKNSDHREATLVVGGQVVLRASLTYGFRNIQNLVRSLSIKHVNSFYFKFHLPPARQRVPFMR